MTEWNASEYARISELQQAMAEEVLSLLDLKGPKHILDVGCGNGKITAEIASRVPQANVLGVDSSADMIAFASTNFGPTVRSNLRFEIADARRLPFREEFDLVVSFNALHWIHEQDEALHSIRSVMRPDGVAQLRLVPAGECKSLENVIEETRLSSGWVRYFQEFSDPYLHLTPEQYGKLAERNGLHVCRINTEAKAWDLKSRSAFLAFGSVTFVEWTRFIPEAERLAFVAMSLIATGSWRPINRAKRIPSSFIRWMSPFRRDCSSASRFALEIAARSRRKHDQPAARCCAMARAIGWAVCAS